MDELTQRINLALRRLRKLGIVAGKLSSGGAECKLDERLQKMVMRQAGAENCYPEYFPHVFVDTHANKGKDVAQVRYGGDPDRIGLQAIGQWAVDTLKDAGLDVHWSGNIYDTIQVSLPKQEADCGIICT